MRYGCDCGGIGVGRIRRILGIQQRTVCGVQLEPRDRVGKEVHGVEVLIQIWIDADGDRLSIGGVGRNAGQDAAADRVAGDVGVLGIGDVSEFAGGVDGDGGRTVAGGKGAAANGSEKAGTDGPGEYVIVGRVSDVEVAAGGIGGDGGGLYAGRDGDAAVEGRDGAVGGGEGEDITHVGG